MRTTTGAEHKESRCKAQFDAAPYWRAVDLVILITSIIFAYVVNAWFALLWAAIFIFTAWFTKRELK